MRNALSRVDSLHRTPILDLSAGADAGRESCPKAFTARAYHAEHSEDFLGLL